MSAYNSAFKLPHRLVRDQSAHLDETNRALVLATQAGLPLVKRPYAAIGEQLGIDSGEVIARLKRLQALGCIRRVGLVPNHYKLGITANGMTVWDVLDSEVRELGARIGALPFVSHCYLRPRCLPLWPYNLFAMVHGSTRAEVENLRERIRTILGESCAQDDVLYSKRILKKTGMRLSPAFARTDASESNSHVST